MSKKPLQEGNEKKGGVNNPPKTPKRPIKPPPQKPKKQVVPNSAGVDGEDHAASQLIVSGFLLTKRHEIRFHQKSYRAQ